MKKICLFGLLVSLLTIALIISGCEEPSRWDQPELLNIASRTPALNATGISYSDSLSITFNFPIDTSSININDLFAAYGSDHTAGTPDLSSATLSWSTDQKTLTVSGIKNWVNPTAGEEEPKIVEIMIAEGKIRDIFKNEIRGEEVLWKFTFKDLSIDWTRTYNNDSYNSHDRAMEIAVDGSGNVYLIGYETGAASNQDIWIGKYNSDGTELWTRTYDGPANGWDIGMDIAVDGSGNVYVIGTVSVSGQLANIWVRKYDGDGNEVWTKTYNGAADDWDNGSDIAVDGSGNVYVAGYETVSGQGLNVWVRKYDGDGNVVWTKTYDGADNDRDISNSIALDGSGNVFVIGSETVTGQDRNIWIRKYDGSGSELWTRTYNGISDGRDEGNGIAVDENGNVYVTGYETVSGQLANVWVRKYDSGGNEVWTETYNNETENGWEVGYGIVVDSSGNVYVGGYENTSSQATNVWARKYQP